MLTFGKIWYTMNIFLIFIMEENFAPKKSFFKSSGKIFTVVLLFIFGLIIFIFIGFFSYYLWVNKYGAEEARKELAERFEPTFSKAPGLSSSQTTPTDKDITTVIRPENATFGTPNAPVTIVAFIDFECPYSERSTPIFEQMKQKYGPTINVVFKHFPLEAIHPNAVAAAKAAQCGHQQQKFWNYYTKIFDQPTLTSQILLQSARDGGLDLEKFTNCIAEESTNQIVTQDFQDGVALGVQGTPTYFVNDKKVEGVVDMETWDTLILEQLQKNP